MRLFIAINLEPSIKKELLDCISSLKKAAISGNFTREENLHLTLAFIGETSRIREAENALRGISASPFTLTLGKTGAFRRSGGDIFWVGLERNPALMELQKQVTAGLANQGFDIEDRKYTPHITLGREVVLKSEPSIYPKSISMTVNRVSLMQSERINGALVYGELYIKLIDD